MERTIVNLMEVKKKYGGFTKARIKGVCVLKG